MQYHWPIALAVLSAGFVLAAGPGDDPAAQGAFQASRQHFTVPVAPGATLKLDLYYPASTNGTCDHAAQPCPVIVLAHGFLQSKEQHVNQGQHLASKGYVVAIPSFSQPADHRGNAGALVAIIDWLLARQTDTNSPLCGVLATNRIGLSGHSAGGLTAVLAAERDARITALSLMDPVDQGTRGAEALAKLRLPLAITYSEPSSCNADGSAQRLYEAARGPKRGVKIVGATHVDPQDPVSALGALVCGAATTNRQALYRRYLAGWFDYYLQGRTNAAPWVFALPGGPVTADVADLRVTYAESTNRWPAPPPANKRRAGEALLQGK